MLSIGGNKRNVVKTVTNYFKNKWHWGGYCEMGTLHTGLKIKLFTKVCIRA
jgi:hypothetical protein